jgi:hypothetical protein
LVAEGELSALREIAAEMTKGSVLAPIFYRLNDDPAASETHLALFADDTCIYAIEKHERRVLCKVQRGLTAVKSWCERWNIKINEWNTQTIYFVRRLGVPEDVSQLNGRDIPFVSNVTYLGFTFDRRITWKLHMVTTVVKSLRTYKRTYSLSKNGRLSTNISLYKALISSAMTHACPIK